MRLITLSNGKEIPCMGFGCFNAFGSDITNAVRTAIENGCTYIDSAEMYQNEADVGAAIGAFSGSRGNLYILSKAWPSSYDDMENACAKSIKNLQSEYLDFYLMHWPGTDEARRLRAYEQMLALTEKGMVRTCGVSNFQIGQLEKIKEEFGMYPVINELECHPTFQQKELVDFGKEHGIQLISYQPINRQADLTLPAVTALAEKYEKTPAQIILRWHLQKDQIPIPKSSHENRIRENMDVFDFELAAEDVAAIDAAETGIRSGRDPYSFPDGF